MNRKARIQGELRMRGNSQRTVADAAGVSEATVSKVVADSYPNVTASSRRTRAAVLDELARQSGLTLEEIAALDVADSGRVRTAPRAHAPAA